MSKENTFVDYDDYKVYKREIEKIPLLTESEEIQLAIRVASGDEEAKKRMAEGNLRLVVNIAKKFINLGVPFLDLIQDGNEGLMNAILNYDLSRGVKFSSFATPVIKHAIIRGICNSSRNIRIPYDEYVLLKQYREICETISKDGNYDIHEVANIMGITLDEVLTLSTINGDTISLFHKSNNDSFGESNELVDYIEDPIDVSLAVTFNDLGHELMQLFRKCNLTKFQIYVLINRYVYEYKYEEIGIFCNKSRQSIQQAEVRALNRLWKNKALKKFAVYMDKPEIFYLEDGTFDVKGYYRRKKTCE